ncbi:MAG TPA: hypothetical protein VK473_08595 [Terriglobales bacterium]|nr:hypothetical protein [Terriglobales bacterium]
MFRAVQHFRTPPRSIVRSLATVLCFLLAGGLPGIAQDSGKPNFSGIWALDPDKSSFGPVTAPLSAQYVIRHIGAKLEFDYIQDGHRTRTELTADGEERVTDSNEEAETLTRTFWSGRTLVNESRVKPRGLKQQQAVKWTSRWTLSGDGKELTIQRHIDSGEQAIDQKVVFVKQPLTKQGES